MKNTPNRVMKHTPCQTFHQARTFVFHKMVNKGATQAQSKEIEKSIIEYTKDQCKTRNVEEVRWSDVRVRRLYIRKAHMIIKNMEKILKKVTTNEIDCSSVATMTHYDIHPDLWQPILERMQKREICTLIADHDKQYNGLLKCEHCSSMNTRYVTVQTRSADEPETVFATCVDCGTNWTMN